LKLTKTDPEKAAETIHNCLWLTKALAVLMEPLLPSKAEAVWEQLGTPKKDVPLAEALEPLAAGTPIAKPKPLFEQISDETLAELGERVSKRIEEASG